MDRILVTAAAVVIVAVAAAIVATVRSWTRS